jgi:hypothetical protein
MFIVIHLLVTNKEKQFIATANGLKLKKLCQ